jgi:AI-2 transport protein TqsA
MNNRFLGAAAAVLVVAVIGWLLVVGRPVIVSVVFGMVAMYVVLGFTTLLRRMPVLGRRLPVGMCYVLSSVLIGLAIAYAIQMVVSNKDVIVALAPRYQDAALALAKTISIMLHLENEPTWESLRRDMLTRINIQSVVGTALASLSSFVAAVAVVLLYAAFLLLERSVFDRKLDQIFRGSDRAARVRLVIREINERIGSYLALKTLLGILLGVLSWLVMKQRGLEFAELWALLIVLFNFIPYLGSILSVLLPVIMSVIQFGQPNEILVLFLLLTVIQFVVGNVVDPYLMGNSLNLSPFAIVVSLAVWSSLWGLSGAFLAIPLTVCLVIVFSEFEATRPVAILLSKNGTLPRFGMGAQD